MLLMLQRRFRMMYLMLCLDADNRWELTVFIAIYLLSCILR